MKHPQTLSGWKIAIPESRELDLFSNMLIERGAQTQRCPLIAIYDTPNKEGIHHWLNHFIREDYTDFVMLTGEGVKRLTRFAESFDLLDPWTTKLQHVNKIVRGPKPGRALRALKLKPDIIASNPTTDGIIETLSQLPLQEKKLAVQLYGEDPNEKLQTFLRDQQVDYSTVAPYIYAPDSEKADVLALIHAIIQGDIHATVFTSTPQITRILKIAKEENKTQALITAMNQGVVAAIGPVVEEKLLAQGIQVKISPEEKFFMKPLVRKLCDFAENLS